MISNDPWNRIKYPIVILLKRIAYLAALGYMSPNLRAKMPASPLSIMTLDEKVKQNS